MNAVLKGVTSIAVCNCICFQRYIYLVVISTSVLLKHHNYKLRQSFNRGPTIVSGDSNCNVGQPVGSLNPSGGKSVTFKSLIVFDQNEDLAIKPTWNTCIRTHNHADPKPTPTIGDFIGNAHLAGCILDWIYTYCAQLSSIDTLCTLCQHSFRVEI